MANWGAGNEAVDIDHALMDARPVEDVLRPAVIMPGTIPNMF